MSVGPKLWVLGSFRVLTSETRVNVSRFGTHRSNEWEGRHGNVPVIHAARDNTVTNKFDNVRSNVKYIKPPAFRQAPNVYNVPISIAVAIGAFEEHPMPKALFYLLS
jgi:hypothetical protein